MSEPWIPSTFSVFPVPGNTAYAPTNVYKNSSALASAMGLSNMTFTGSEADPNGGTFAVLLTETAATGTHDAPQTSIPIVAGAPVTLLGLSQGGRPSLLRAHPRQPRGNVIGATFDLSAGVVTASGKTGAASGLTATISAAANGYFRCAISGDP